MTHVDGQAVAKGGRSTLLLPIDRHPALFLISIPLPLSLSSPSLVAERLMNICLNTGREDDDFTASFISGFTIISADNSVCVCVRERERERIVKIESQKS